MFAVLHEALHPGYPQTSVLSTPLTGPAGGPSSTSIAVSASITASAKDEPGVPVLAKDGALSVGGTSRRPRSGQERLFDSIRDSAYGCAVRLFTHKRREKGAGLCWRSPWWRWLRWSATRW